ncbi:Uncharacterised protein [Vibrio cholerae]|nr:Uncharacterised protein [Vibrio cholerae]CSD23138.1 Uncharacterised protein [Vibrio cholerae]CSI08385.1 Uncharacterised protein [Vibrio cholerae]
MRKRGGFSPLFIVIPKPPLLAVVIVLATFPSRLRALSPAVVLNHSRAKRHHIRDGILLQIAL